MEPVHPEAEACIDFRNRVRHHDVKPANLLGKWVEACQNVRKIFVLLPPEACQKIKKMEFYFLLLLLCYHIISLLLLAY